MVFQKKKLDDHKKGSLDFNLCVVMFSNPIFAIDCISVYCYCNFIFYLNKIVHK